MSRLWVRLSLAFTAVFIVSTLVIGIVMRLSTQSSLAGEAPPPEVIAYFEQLRSGRSFPDPTLALVVVGSIAIVAGILVSRGLAAPMSELEDAAIAIGKQDFTRRVTPHGSQEMVAVASAFNEMAAQLELAEQMRRKMLSDVAHELRHPLHVLQGNLQAMVDGIYPLSEEEIERLIVQTRHLTVLVNDLHVLAQAEARQLPLHIRQVDIAQLVKDVASAYQPLADARSIGLHVELLGTVPAAIRVDQDRTRQTLQNLMENALRHTPDGGQIHIELEAVGDQLVIKVVDTGQGIAADQLPLLFDRLYRGDQARPRTADSTGLGLAIARAILEAQGGRITAHSDGLGFGSTFTIELPLDGPK